jgi:hypothetical protein
MMVTARRLRSIGWMATLVVCVALVMILAFRVNALRSQVQAKIIALKQETMYLETEFETRANQQQLKNWNDVEFGYVAPVASQYLDNERQLASYAKPVEPDAPAPIRVASADDAVVAAAAFPAMVSPMTGQSMNVEATREASPAAAHATGTVQADDDDTPKPAHKAVTAAGLAGLGERLGTVHHAAHTTDRASEKAKPAKLAAKKPAAAKTKSAKAIGEKSPSRAFAGHVVRPKEHLASAEPRRRVLPSAHSGTPLIKYALRDAKPVK